jgi:hypothetical protein
VDKAVAATCTAQGFTTYTCVRENCGYSRKSNYTNPTNHVGTTVVDKAVAPDCVNTGLTEGSHCIACDKVLIAQRVVSALGHSEVVVPAKAANCTETGLTEGKVCSVCGVTTVEQTVVDAKGHVEVVDKAVAATCTTDGKTEGKKPPRKPRQKSADEPEEVIRETSDEIKPVDQSNDWLRAVEEALNAAQGKE